MNIPPLQSVASAVGLRGCRAGRLRYPTDEVDRAIQPGGAFFDAGLLGTRLIRNVLAESTSLTVKEQSRAGSVSTAFCFDWDFFSPVSKRLAPARNPCPSGAFFSALTRLLTNSGDRYKTISDAAHVPHYSRNVGVRGVVAKVDETTAVRALALETVAYARDLLAKRGAATPACNCDLVGHYFSEELIAVNLVFRFDPSPFTIAIIASEIPAAISPYSIAVAAVSSAQNLRRVFFMPAV